MKRFLFLFALAWMTLSSFADTTFPTISTGESETWYYIQMQNGGGVCTCVCDPPTN